jgi:5-methylcytosine-specific restriction endonuclease McrA
MEKKVKIITKQVYSKLLRQKEWKVKRIVILERDGYTCQKCGNSPSSLHVHHKLYIHGKLPWEYSNKHLITLCGICHMHEHKTNIIPVIGKKTKKQTQKKNPNAQKKRIEKLKKLNEAKQKERQEREKQRIALIPKWRLEKKLESNKY